MVIQLINRQNSPCEILKNCRAGAQLVGSLWCGRGFQSYTHKSPLISSLVCCCCYCACCVALDLVCFSIVEHFRVERAE